MVWGSTFPTYLLKLASIQNKPVKLIDEGHVLESSIQFYAKLKILKLLDLYKFKTAKLVHNYMNRNFLLRFPVILINHVMYLTVQQELQKTRITCTNHYSIITECKEVLNIKVLKYGIPFHNQFKNFQKLLSRLN